MIEKINVIDNEIHIKYLGIDYIFTGDNNIRDLYSGVNKLYRAAIFYGVGTISLDFNFMDFNPPLREDPLHNELRTLILKHMPQHAS